MITAPYFRDCISAADLDDLHIEIIRNTLYKAYLEDFSRFCSNLGGPTSEIMHDILSFEADRRTINITINSFGTELNKEQRAKLFPAIGRLFPEGNNALARADDIEQVRQACDYIPEYRAFFDTSLNRPGGGVSGDEFGDDSIVSQLDMLADVEAPRETASPAMTPLTTGCTKRMLFLPLPLSGVSTRRGA